MKEQAERAPLWVESKSRLLILLLVPLVSLCGCANDAFLQPPENLPYAQEQQSDSSSDAARMPPLMDVN